MTSQKLKKGDHIRVIAPAESFSSDFTDEKKKRAIKTLQEWGLTVDFGKYVYDSNDFDTCSVDKRLEDLHEAFSDPKVTAVISANGGSSGNQLLKKIDYDLIKNNPKIFCGLSDNTEFCNAFFKKTKLVTYNGPNFTTLAESTLSDYSFEYMKKILFSEAPITLEPCEHYSNSKHEDEIIVNEGFWTINTGEAEAPSLGGNLLTCNFMLGNNFMPELENCILFIEENKIIDYKGVEKEIQEILNHSESGNIKGLLIGRFQRQTKMSRERLTEIIKSKKELENVPVIGNVDLGHTVPIATFPYGGRIKMRANKNDDVLIQIVEH